MRVKIIGKWIVKVTSSGAVKCCDSSILIFRLEHVRLPIGLPSQLSELPIRWMKVMGCNLILKL